MLTTGSSRRAGCDIERSHTWAAFQAEFKLGAAIFIGAESGDNGGADSQRRMPCVNSTLG